MELSERDQQLLTVLSRKVRLFSIRQIAGSWWSSSKAGLSNARRRLAQLVSAGWLNKLRIFAEPSPPLAAPVATWEPNSTPPEFGPIAWRLQSRWTEPARDLTVYFASKFCGQQFGGKGRDTLKSSSQNRHDLGVSQVFLHYRQHRPVEASHWVGEDIFARSRQSQIFPDAMLVESDVSKPYRCIEFGGAYSKQRIATFHHDCQNRHLAYEIW